jgi:hypothetical protein
MRAARQRELFQQTRVVLDPIPVFQVQHGLDGIDIEPRLVVTDTARLDCGLTVENGLAALALIAEGECQRTEDSRSVKAHAGLACDLYGLIEKDGGGLAITLVHGGATEILQPRLIEAKGSQSFGEMLHGNGLSTQLSKIHQLIGRKQRTCTGVELRSLVADRLRLLGGCQRRREDCSLRKEIEPRMRHHRVVGDLDTAEPVLSTKRNAAFEIGIGRAHPATDVLGITKTSQRLANSTEPASRARSRLAWCSVRHPSMSPRGKNRFPRKK